MSEYEPGRNTTAFREVVTGILASVDYAHTSGLTGKNATSDKPSENERLIYIPDTGTMYGTLRAGDELRIDTYEFLGPGSPQEHSQKIRLVATVPSADKQYVQYAVITQGGSTYQGQAVHSPSRANQHQAIFSHPNEVLYCRNNPDFNPLQHPFAIEDTAQFVDGVLAAMKAALNSAS